MVTCTCHIFVETKVTEIRLIMRARCLLGYGIQFSRYTQWHCEFGVIKRRIYGRKDYTLFSVCLEFVNWHLVYGKVEIRGSVPCLVRARAWVKFHRTWRFILVMADRCSGVVLFFGMHYIPNQNKLKCVWTLRHLATWEEFIGLEFCSLVTSEGACAFDVVKVVRTV